MSHQRMKGVPLALLLVLTGRAFAEGSGAGVIAGQVTDRVTSAAVGNATIVLSGAGTEGLRHLVAGPDGSFIFDGLAPGTYNILVVYGGARERVIDVQVAAGETSRVAPTLGVTAAGEQITVRERVGRPPMAAMPVHETVPRRLPYSDTAIDDNVWGLAWVLLTVDASGKVTAAQFLRHPGHDLDKIAMGVVFKLRFEPARDAAGQPVTSKVLWRLEWPSYWWLQDPATHPSKPPCRGSPAVSTRPRPAAPESEPPWAQVVWAPSSAPSSHRCCCAADAHQHRS